MFFLNLYWNKRGTAFSPFRHLKKAKIKSYEKT